MDGFIQLPVPRQTIRIVRLQENRSPSVRSRHASTFAQRIEQLDCDVEHRLADQQAQRQRISIRPRRPLTSPNSRRSRTPPQWCLAFDRPRHAAAS
jgi:hypothetical protein